MSDDHLRSNVESYERFVRASLSVEVLILIFLLIIIAKEALQLYKKIESPIGYCT